MHLTFFASALRLGLIHTAASVCLFFSGSAIRRLTGGEWGPCIGAARSVARVTSRAETCVFVSVLYFTSFVLHDGFPGSVRIRKKKTVSLKLFLAGSATDPSAALNKQPRHAPPISGFSPNFQSTRANAAPFKVTAVLETAFLNVRRTYLCFLKARVM